MNAKSNLIRGLVLDTDKEHEELYRFGLNKLNLELDFCSSSENVQSKISNGKYAFCILDLDLSRPELDFKIIKDIRDRVGPEIPILIVTENTDHQAIAHTLELGANDFILKPISKKLLASKLSNYFFSEELAEHHTKSYPIPEDRGKATLELDFEVREVDELGLKLISKHLLIKGATLTIEGTFLQALTGMKEPIHATIASTWIETGEQAYGAYAEFDRMNEETGRSIRRWLTREIDERK